MESLILGWYFALGMGVSVNGSGATSGHDITCEQCSAITVRSRSLESPLGIVELGYQLKDGYSVQYQHVSGILDSTDSSLDMIYVKKTWR